MRVDVRPTKKLRGDKPMNLTEALGPIIDALCADSVDLSRLRVVCDWIQYRNNFRDVVDLRQILPPTGTRSTGDLEVAVDLRRCGEEALAAQVADMLREFNDPASSGRHYLEDWTATSASRIWDFNALYWRELGIWEESTGQQYEQALPGGQSDARNAKAARDLIGELFQVWDSLAERNSLPDELYVVELGVGNGIQAKTWLDEFVAMDRALGRDYYRRLHYLMCDYSEHVLALARANVADHIQHVSSFALDATAPTTALGFLRYKVFLAYISNVYDNLPTDEVARIGDHTYYTQARAYLADQDARRIAAGLDVDPTAVTVLADKLLRLGPNLLTEVHPAQFPDVESAAGFWRQVWGALRLEERYVPLRGLDLYQVAPGVSGEMLRPFLEQDGDIRMHVSNGALASFADTLPILHPYGRLQCHDLFVTETQQYGNGFRGPGKYDGSIVNWVNGPLLQHLGSRKGFDVRFAPFAHRPGTNILTLTAQVRD
ncbi:MAG: hypothetical protein GEU98_17585 [Pseudonocardiaceae bacterium]|nr:hypothetical protein [Pseudonocardiaceae bacterium]